MSSAVNGLVVSSGLLTTVANTLTADQVSGTFQFLPKGYITLVCKASATGVQASLIAGGIVAVNLQTIPFTGTAGTISTKDNVMFTHLMEKGRCELKFNNTTGGTPTVEWILLWSANAN